MSQIQDLNKLYSEAESVDKEIFAEQRSNVLLVSGEHYARRGSRYYNQIRDSKSLNETQKLRLTKNHIHRAARYYKAALTSAVSTAKILPKNESEMQDQKAAELNEAVKEDIKQRYRIKEKIRQYIADFSDIGEACVVVKWRDDLGDDVGFEPLVDEDGNEVLDAAGQQLPDETKPVKSGAFEFCREYGMNVLRHPGCKEMGESECIIVRKMVDKNLLLDRYKGDAEKTKFVNSASGDEYVVFDAAKGNYDKAKDQVLVREYYYRKGAKYPKGYFFITTSTGVLEEGELPGGIFPVVWAGFDIFQNSPRGRSWIKQARPYQAEINRAASAIAMHQITLGDDKVLYQSGTKLATGALIPGVRGVTYQGAPPTVLPGRDGSQYMAYVDQTIQEMDRVLMIPEEFDEKQSQMDPYALLFKSVRETARFSEYKEKLEQFIMDFWEVSLELAKFYYPDDVLIKAVGKDEIVNISEFRQTSPLQTIIKIEPQDETADNLMGKFIAYNNIMQYVGQKLERDDIGKLIQNMPYLNKEDTFSEFTIDSDVVKNDMLALERGGQPEPSPYVDPSYAIRKLTVRMKQSSYQFLPEEIRANYEAYKNMYMQIEAEQAKAEADAKNEFIPVGGAMVACDIYLPNQDDPSKSGKRARIPYQALDWLISRLESQGATLDKLETMNQGNLEDMAQMVLGQSGQQPGAEGEQVSSPQGMLVQ